MECSRLRKKEKGVSINFIREIGSPFGGCIQRYAGRPDLFGFEGIFEDV